MSDPSWSARALKRHRPLLVLLGLLPACGEDGAPAGARSDGSSDASAITYRADITQVTSFKDAQPNVFIPPFTDCREPKEGESGQGEGGKVCTNVAISGCTEPGKYFPDYGSCEVVRTQRPFWDEAPAAETPANDPRLADEDYMRELGWVTEQVAACGCTCCHDARSFGGRFGQWDISHGGIWLDTLSDTGLALFAGLADSSVLGAYPADENHGFNRDITGIPSTDSARMQAFMLAELERRGITRSEAEAVPPFGGPIYTQSVAKPGTCQPGEGVASTGHVRWLKNKARYVYVLEAGSKNPGVPPNLDLPAGTLWRLDVLASKDPIASGLLFGTTPPGSFQAFPEQTPAEPLQKGETYQLVVLADVGVPLANCLFVFGEADAEPAPVQPAQDAGTADAGSAAQDGGSAPSDASSQGCTLPGGDARGFGATCSKKNDCSCEADYCAMQPGASEGYCTKSDCEGDPSVCPSGWECFDLSIFSPGLPTICSQP